jgi:hypothetical protein
MMVCPSANISVRSQLAVRQLLLAPRIGCSIATTIR